MKKTILVVIIALQMIILVSCGGAGDSEESKTYTWDNVSFTVKDIKEEASSETSGKRIALTIDFGDSEMKQGVFENNVSKGMLTLKGVKPDGEYLYHMGKTVFGSNGFEAAITGETVMYFNMDADYVINESDLVITE